MSGMSSLQYSMIFTGDIVLECGIFIHHTRIVDKIILLVTVPIR